jgi:hypothetical protein
MFVLIVQSGKHSGRRVKLPPGEAIVGRDENARVRIASSEVSRQHCRLTVSPEGVQVVDLDSRNGTYVDGVPIAQPVFLRPGGTLTVGPMTFRLEGGAASPRRAVELPGSRDSEDKAKQGLSDDEIASLLSDDFGSISASDTTIHGEDSADIPQLAPSTPTPKAPPKREFKTVAEEAREIIRLHLESLEKPDVEQGREQ